MASQNKGCTNIWLSPNYFYLIQKFAFDVIMNKKKPLFDCRRL